MVFTNTISSSSSSPSSSSSSCDKQAHKRQQHEATLDGHDGDVPKAKLCGAGRPLASRDRIPQGKGGSQGQRPAAASSHAGSSGSR